MKNIYIIINPISGISSKDKIPALANEILNPEIFKTNIVITEYAGHATELTRKAIEEKADYIIAVGGDGTVNEVARTMIHSDAALGIIPVGSGNGLARDLGYPTDPRKAFEIIAKQNLTTIDYCKANEHIFFCTCGFGFDASVSGRFAEEKKRGSITYLKSIILEYLRFRPDTYEIGLDGETIIEKAFLVTCANASQYGYNAYIAPHANIRDGKMDVAVISPINPLEAGPLAVQLFLKQIDKNSKMNHYRSSTVTIKRSEPGIMHIDGDPIHAGKEITIKTIPQGLHVIIPTKEDRQTPMQAQIQDIQSFFREIIRRIEDIKPTFTIQKT